MTEAPFCSAIIVNYNGKKLIDACLQSFLALDYPEHRLEIVVVDNGSTDGSDTHVETSYPRVRLVRSRVNNFGAALNQGVYLAQGSYVGFVNNDVVVDSAWLRELVRFLEQDRTAGCAGGKILFRNGRINSVGHKPLADFYWEDLGFNEKDKGQYDALREVEGLCWAAVLFRKECLDDVGPVDEDFVLYCEDVDMSKRCRDRGWKIWYVPQARAWHEFHGSSQGSRLPEYFCDRARLIFVAKHHPYLLAQSVKSSRFYVGRELESLYEAMPVTIKKLVQHHPLETVDKVLAELCDTLVTIFGDLAVDHLLRRMEVILGYRKLSVGFYDHALHVIGGGQRYGCTMASVLQDKFDVTLIANKLITGVELEDWYQLPLSRCTLKILPLPFYEHRGAWIDSNVVTPEVDNPFEAISAESQNYDIFVNTNMLTMVRPLSPFSIFICHFPDTLRRCYFAVDDYSCLIVNSEYSAHWVKERWGLEPNLVLYPPVDAATARAPKENIILSAARFEPGGSKKQRELIQAFERLLASDPDFSQSWRLILVGGSLPQNQYLEEVQELAQRSKARIDVLVNVSFRDLQNLYAKSKVFWHACGLNETNPHLVEHFGMTTVEAMQNYCVPIVINGGGQREIVEHGRSGYLFDTVDDLLRYTRDVIANAELMLQLQEDAYQRSQVFTRQRFEESVGRFFDLIKQEYAKISLPDPAAVLKNEHSTNFFSCRAARKHCSFFVPLGLGRTNSGGDKDLQRASELWGERARQKQDDAMPVVAWTDSSLVQQLYIHPTISGKPDDNWLIWVAKKYFPQSVQWALSIGCGDGCLERHALQLDIAQYFDAIDASSEAIDIARRKASKLGYADRVNYVVADLGRHRFEPHKYDVAFAAMALHHIKELEHVLTQIQQSLKPGALFILNEYVGPDQFQWTETQLELANELLLRIPEGYRRSLTSGQLKTRVIRQTREQMNWRDPTEAIRSSEIVLLVSQMFDLVERVYYGGTLVNLVLEEIAGNFRPVAEDLALLKMLFEAEKRLLREGVIPSDFALIITRNRA